MRHEKEIRDMLWKIQETFAECPPNPESTYDHFLRGKQAAFEWVLQDENKKNGETMKVLEYDRRTRLSLKGRNPDQEWYTRHQQLMDVLDSMCPTPDVTSAKPALAALGWNLIPPLR